MTKDMIETIIAQGTAHASEDIIASFQVAESCLGIYSEALVHAYALTTGSIVDLMEDDIGFDIMSNLETKDLIAIYSMIKRVARLAYEWGVADARAVPLSPPDCISRALAEPGKTPVK